jgi:signal transduction histidine kinase
LPDPQAVPPVPDPFLPIEQDQTGWPMVMLLVVLPLMLRRRYPLLVLWIVLAMAPLVSDFDAALRLSFYACVIGAYSAAVYSPYRIPALASLPVAALIYTQLSEDAVPTVPDNAVPFLILIPIALAAAGLRRWQRRADEHRARLSTLEHEQADALRRAVEHERSRIARELHDVVTHNVSVMVIQAGAARKVLDTAPDQSREALLAVEAGGRAAMAELRHVMGLLTMDSDGPDPAGATDLTPQPGLDLLDALVQRVRDTGVSVELTVAGSPRPLPSGVELAAYRVVQEALTNTVKHAVGAAATVLVEYGTGELRVEVTDTGGTPGASAATGNRRGLIGLRERLAVYGGTLHTRPRISGGYRLTAQIPLETA